MDRPELLPHFVQRVQGASVLVRAQGLEVIRLCKSMSACMSARRVARGFSEIGTAAKPLLGRNTH